MLDVQTLLSTLEEIVDLLKETQTTAYLFAPGSIVVILQREIVFTRITIFRDISIIFIFILNILLFRMQQIMCLNPVCNMRRR